jgi:hypothetical protein
MSWRWEWMHAFLCLENVDHAMAQRLAALGEIALPLHILASPFSRFDPDRCETEVAQVIGRGLHVYRAHVAGERECIGDDVGSEHRIGPIGPLVQIHSGVQAAGLFEFHLRCPCRLDRVQWGSGSGIEPEGIEVCASQRSGLHHLSDAVMIEAKWP